MKKIISYLFIAISTVILIFLASVYSISDQKLYSEFLANAKITLTKPDEVKYRVHRFPYLCLEIDDLKQVKKIELQNIKVKFSLLALLSFNYQVSDILIDHLLLYLSNDNVNFPEHDKFIGELIKQDILGISAKVKKLAFVESDNDIPFVIENFVFNKQTSDINKFTGTIPGIGDLNGSFTKNHDLVDFALTISASDYSFNLQETYNQAQLQNGKIAMTTSKFTDNLAQVGLEFASLPGNFSSNEEVKINLDIEPQEGWLNFKNITIDSASIKGTGEIALSTKNEINKIVFNFSKIDLDSWSNKNHADTNAQDSKNLARFTSVSSSFDLLKKPLIASIKAKEIKLSDNDTLTDVAFDASSKDGQINIDNFFGVINESGQFKVAGFLSQNAFRTIFKGKIALVHNDLNDLVQIIGDKNLKSDNKIPYNLVADIKLSSVDIALQNLLIKTANTEIAGSISKKFIGNSPRTNANLKFTKINLDEKNFPAFRQLYDYAMDLSSGSKKDDYLNKFIALRKISAINNYDITFDKLILNSTIYNNMSFSLDLSPGRVRLENLLLNDGKNYLDMSFDLIASGIKPVLNIIIHDGKIKTSFMSPPSLLALRKEILENIALDKIALNMNFALSKIDNNGFELGRVVFKGKNNDNLFEISSFEADILGGRLVSSGSILLEPYTMNFVYAINSALMSEIAKTLPDGMISSKGLISINGMLSTNGNTLEEQLYNLYTNSNIMAKDLVISDFSIDDMIETINSTKYEVKNLQDDIKKALLTGQTEIDDLKAQIELSKGLFILSKIEFKTKYASGTASAEFNLYDFNMDMSSILSFYVNKAIPGRGYTNKVSTKLSITANGNLLSLKKAADTKELEALLSSNEGILVKKPTRPARGGNK